MVFPKRRLKINKLVASKKKNNIFTSTINVYFGNIYNNKTKISLLQLWYVNVASVTLDPQENILIALTTFRRKQKSFYIHTYIQRDLSMSHKSDTFI